MNFVKQLEESLRDLGAEARKNHPGVKEASERAVLKLRTLQNQYVTAVRKASAQGEKHPDTTLFRSSDLLHPFLLAANYPNASPKLLDTSFKAMKSLMEANAICPGDGMNMVRVWIIQAHVVVSYSSTTVDAGAKQKGSLGTSDLDGLDDVPENGATSSLVATAATTSSWFGSLISSSSSAAAETVKSTANSVVNKTAVSSSHGQAGSGHINSKFLEKLALDILSCLLQLLELRDLPVTKEQWTQSVTLCCLFLKLKQQVVRQAASSTLPQVLSLLFRDDQKFATRTWEDLTICMARSHINSKTKLLQGAFAQCRVGEKDAPIPPSLATSMDLMTSLLQENPTIFKSTGPKTLGIIVQTFQKLKGSPAASPLDFVRVLQFILVVLQTQADVWPEECREVVLRVIEPISTATDALRHQPEFEDGYVYKQTGEGASPNFDVVKNLPPTTIWKAGLCMETLKLVIHHTSIKSLWMHQDVLLPLVEAVSDFCTIGASCRDNIHLLVAACRQSRSLLFTAEAIATSTNNSQWWVLGKDAEDQFVLGSSLWIGLETTLKLIDPQMERKTFEEAFSPSLAVLQHCLKRFQASGTIVKRSLEGYYRLSTVALKSGPLLRCALLTSLCKLSLPQWGTQSASGMLRDNHVASLICLLNIVHRLHDYIGVDWQVVLQTFEELSIFYIASPDLSNSAYESALCVSAVYGRFASFSTCMSDESLKVLVESLSLVAIATAGIASVNGSQEAPDVTRSNGNGKDDSETTISGKLIHLGVRAIYGNNESGADANDDVPLTSRTKETFYYHYKTELSRRLAASKHPVRTGRLRFSTALLCDIAIANSFRYERIGSSIATQLCAIASSSNEDGEFALDAMAMISLSHLAESFAVPNTVSGPGKIKHEDPRQNQYLIVQTDELDGSNGQSVDQKELLAPLCACILTEQAPQVAENALSALHSIVESAGHRLSGPVWTILIGAIASFNTDGRSTKAWRASCLVAFRCLRLVVEDFVEATSDMNKARITLMDCCFSFALSKHDVNTSLTSVGLLWKIADQSSTDETVELGLSRLARAAADTRAEVRNCAVNTLFSCIVGRGQDFTIGQWETCLSDTVIGVYDGVMSKGEGSVLEQQQQSASNQSRYRLSVHHSRDSEDKQWVVTQAIVVRGICRVLRSYFGILLESTEFIQTLKNSTQEPPWFEEVWNRFLGFSLAASTAEVGRDTMDLRNAGVDLMVLSCQLSCSAGIRAAITPARVSTNMEVVNGALRSVRSPNKDASASSLSKRSNSSIVETWRENFFLDAFDVLESFRDFISSGGTEMESTQIQILSKFAGDLGKLYDCCKDNELGEGQHDDLLRCLSEEPTRDEDGEGMPKTDKSLIERFLDIVMTVANKACSGSSLRFLSPAQKSAMDTLKSMASNGSCKALVILTDLAGSNILCNEKNAKVDNIGVSLLGLEAASILSHAIAQTSVSDECRVYIMTKSFSILSQEWKVSKDQLLTDGYSFKVLAVMMKHGLESSLRLASTSTDHVAANLISTMWAIVGLSLENILSSISSPSDAIRSGLYSEIVDIVKSLENRVPSWSIDSICEILSSSASKCFDMAKTSSQVYEESADPKEKTGVLALFVACFSSAISLDPNNQNMQRLVKKILIDTKTDIAAASSGQGDSPSVHVQASLMIFETLKSMSGVEPFIVAVYSQLCALITTNHESIRGTAGTVLALVDIGDILSSTTQRLEQAEIRADQAEQRGLDLAKTVKELEKKNDLLERQFSAVSAGSSLGLT